MNRPRTRAALKDAADPLIYVLRHTHWDREWYHPAARFRKRLVDLVDGLLSDLPNVFLLDGQAIVLRDYLAVRPERTAEIAAALQGGRLEAGPWFVLPDELIPGGEALVRNLLAGRRVLRGLRAAPPPVLYSPDAFGHPAALPALAAGFGCHCAIVWRGYGGRRSPPGDAARWLAPGGDTTLLFHLAPDGYELGANLPADNAPAAQRFAVLRRVLEPRSSLGVWLVPNGADHHAPQRGADAAIAALARAADPLRVVTGGLQRLALLLQERAAQTQLPQVAGELRDSYGYTWTLQGTFATRAHQKRHNALIERELQRDVEPWAALARLREGASLRHHVNHAWETLLASHPHDSLCGCAIDDVARAVDLRQADARALATEIRESALAALLEHDPDAARARQADWQTLLVLRNPAARVRGGVAEIDWDVPLRHVPVGPHSAGRTRALRSSGSIALPMQELARERLHARDEAPRHYPINYLVERRRVLAWVPPLPAYGVVSLPLAARGPDSTGVPEVRAERRVIHGTAGRLTANGSVLRWRTAGATRDVSPLVSFDIVGERGDTYTHSPVPQSARRGTPMFARVALRGPLRAAIDTAWRVARRGAPAMQVHARLSLDAGAPFLRIAVHGDNRIEDQRLRVVLHTGVQAKRVLADAAFALLERRTPRIPARDQRAEHAPSTAPLHRFVSLFGSSQGCTIVSDGLAEYEVLDDGRVAITLVRAVGELSRDDLPERPGHAGWPAPTPLAQCHGPFAANFAMAWHGADSPAQRARIVELVDDVLLPIAGTTQRDALGLPAPVHGIALEGEGLSLSAIKESDDGRFLVLRCLNVSDVAVQGAWRVPRAHVAARLGRLDETPLDPLPSEGGYVPISVAAHAIHTTLIALSDAEPSR